MLKYPLSINHRSNKNSILKDRDFIKHFEICVLKWILSRGRVLLMRLENPQERVAYEITMRNCLGSFNEGILFDQLLRFEVRFGVESSYVHEEVIQAGYSDEVAERFADVLLWDQTNETIPKFRAVVEKITIEQEDIMIPEE